jgi:hypothetical protein
MSIFIGVSCCAVVLGLELPLGMGFQKVRFFRSQAI